MTISSTTRKAGPFVGNDVTTALPFTFKVFSTADLRVVELDVATGVESDLALTTDYTVSLNANQDSNPGGTVTLNSALATGKTAIVTSSLEYLQPTDLTNQGGFYPKVISNALDRLTIFVQQIVETLNRSLTLPITSLGVSTELPVPEALSVIGWNTDGDALVNYDAGSLAGAIAAVDWRTDIFDGTGSADTFTLVRDPGVASNCDVAIGGVTQTPGVDFTVSDTTITFTTAPIAGTGNVVVRYGSALPSAAAVPTDGVATASIQDGAVTVAKLGTGAIIGTDIQAHMASASQAEMEAGTEAGLRAMSPLRVKQAIAALAPAPTAFPSGTKMLFQQTAAPTGWTKDTTHNDKALRVVSGTAGSGGSSAFSTVFGKTATDGHTLTTSDMPSHAHQEYGSSSSGVNSPLYSWGGGGNAYGFHIDAYVNDGFTSAGALNTGAAGGGGSHSHNIDIRVQYVDLIIATKD